MKMINNLPDPSGLSKSEILSVLLKEEYGKIPSRPYSVSAEILSDENMFAGKARLKKCKLNCKSEWGEYSFPFWYMLPKDKTNVPSFIHLNFTNLIPDKYQPSEEILDAGYAVFSIHYKDVSSDDADFTDGLAGVVYHNGIRNNDDCGKIGLWAWAAIALFDYTQTLPELNHHKVSVVGHSRLGKTALLAGALEEKFYCAFSNDSGCSGASIARESTGERISDIVRVFPFWFCKNYYKYANREESLPFDQHWLLCANIPHKVYVASALDDTWACPRNEYISCIAADSYYKGHGLKGFIHPDRYPEAEELFHDGDIGYHLRKGSHFLSGEDWQNYIRYLNS